MTTRPLCCGDADGWKPFRRFAALVCEVSGQRQGTLSRFRTLFESPQGNGHPFVTLGNGFLLNEQPPRLQSNTVHAGVGHEHVAVGG